MSMHQKDVGIHPAPEPSPACVYAVNEANEKLHFILSSKWGCFALLYGQDKRVCSSVMCTSDRINFASVLPH